MSSLTNITSRFAKTFKKFSMCGAPRPIGNSNIGDDLTQCGKFQRFRNIYNQFRADPNREVSYLIKEINSTIILFDAALSSTYNQSVESAQTYIDRLDQFSQLINQKRGAYLQFLATEFPEGPKYDQLKGELANFINFVAAYYNTKLDQVISMAEEANAARVNMRKSMSLASNSTLSLPSLSRNSSNSSLSSGEWFPRNPSMTVPNWKGRKGRKGRKSRKATRKQKRGTRRA